ncbi:MAG: sulfotransferase domain-containing protein [Chlamydiales bacterium]|nr:sulfotransferase domain-containing protein [Chlamydiales bacterium]
MKILMLIMVLLNCTFYPQGFSNQLDNAHNETFFLSLKRTGTNWTLAALQVLTNRYIVPAENYPSRVDNKPNRNRLQLSLNESKPPFYRTHYVDLLESVCKEDNKLFIIIRDYRETTLRYLKQNKNKEILYHNYDYLVDDYIRMLAYFEAWPEENRHYFYYEDLIEKPKETLKSLVEFLGESDADLESFMKHHDDYKNKVADSYHSMWHIIGGSISRGADVRYHASRAPVSLVAEIENVFANSVPENLRSKYLGRYNN